MKQEKYDIAVIGSGIGGLCSAALLASRGYKTLVVEKLPAMGGRCSTLQYKGYKLVTGVIGVPMGGMFRQLFEEVGVKYDARAVPPGCYRIGKKDFQLPERGHFRALLAQVCKDDAEVEVIRNAVKCADTWEDPSNEISLRDWLLQYTSNEDVLELFQSMCAAYLVANSWEASAKEFFRSRREMMRAYGQMGFVPQGSISLMQGLANVVQSKGGAVWTQSEVHKILVDDGKAVGMITEGQNGETEITAGAVISNAGPKATIKLAGPEHFDRGYLREAGKILPGFQMWVATISDRPLHNWHMVSTLHTRRLLSFNTVTHVCPEWAPPGKHLCLSTSGPHTQIGPHNLKQEVDLHIQDLRECIPGFDKHAEILHVGCFNSEWPAIHNMALVGHAPLSQKTPVENLYNVGDGVGISGFNGGVLGCTITAKIVADDIAKRIPVGS